VGFTYLVQDNLQFAYFFFTGISDYMNYASIGAIGKKSITAVNHYKEKKK
jgi:hypothetical protein